MTPHEAFNTLMGELSKRVLLDMDDACMAMEIYDTLTTISDGREHKVILNGIEGTLSLSKPMTPRMIALYLYIYGVAVGQEKNQK